MDIFEKLGIDPSKNQAELLKILEQKKYNTLRKLNNVFDNPEKESELKNELDHIEAAELIVKNGTQSDEITTGLLRDGKSAPQSPQKDQKTKGNVEKYTGEDEATLLYETGLGYGREDKYQEALPYYEKAANLGHADAQYELAYIYANGLDGIPQDMGRAEFWYTKSAEQGHLFAMNNLGVIYSRRDRKKALEYYTKSAQGGNAVAMGNAGYSYLEDKNYPEAYLWLKKYKLALQDEYEKQKVQGSIDSILDQLKADKGYGPFQPKNQQELDAKENSYLSKIAELNEFLKVADSEDRETVKGTLQLVEANLSQAKEFLKNNEQKIKTSQPILIIVPIILYFIIKTPVTKILVSSLGSIDAVILTYNLLFPVAYWMLACILVRSRLSSLKKLRPFKLFWMIPLPVVAYFLNFAQGHISDFTLSSILGILQFLFFVL